MASGSLVARRTVCWGLRLLRWQKQPCPFSDRIAASCRPCGGVRAYWDCGCYGDVSKPLASWDKQCRAYMSLGFCALRSAEEQLVSPKAWLRVACDGPVVVPNDVPLRPPSLGKKKCGPHGSPILAPRRLQNCTPSAATNEEAEVKSLPLTQRGLKGFRYIIKQRAAKDIAGTSNHSSSTEASV